MHTGYEAGSFKECISILHFFGFTTVRTHNLASLHTILSTGSPLKPASYDYVYSSIKHNVLLGSISGEFNVTLSLIEKNLLPN